MIKFKGNLPTVPGKGLVTPPSTQLRLDFLDSIDILTDQIADSQMDLANIRNNIESYVGTVEIPLGLVGPLLFNDFAKEELVYCVAGTLEGALVASMNRGAKAVSMSGGFRAEVAWQKMCRVPMFLFRISEEAALFEAFIPSIFDGIKITSRKYSNHAELLEIKPVRIKNVVHLRFIYSTGDASGQNMTTICTWHAMLFIIKELKQEKGIVPLDFVIEGNGSSDKKLSRYNMQSGRGMNVKSECFLPEKIINEVLRTTSQKIENCFRPSQELARKDGMIGYNINVANAIAAIFVATGQDLASIHESGVGILELERTGAGLHLTLNLPNLVIGTVGGGTHLARQSQALEIMDCKGSGKAERFAKLIAGFALGLEISTYAAIVSGEFAKAHEKLGRNKPVDWLLRSELDHEFIKDSLNDFFDDKKIINISLKDETILENGIITNLAARVSKKLIGFIPLEIKYENKEKENITVDLLLKSKALDEEVIKGLHALAASINPELSDLLKASKEYLEYKNCHLKELELYTCLYRMNYRNMPKFYGQHIDHKREIFFLIQEFVNKNSLRIINSENNPEKWKKEDIVNTIKAITDFHQNVNIAECKHVLVFEIWESKKLYHKLLSILIAERAECQHVSQLESLGDELNNLKEEEKNIQIKKTIIHNDFNPRNIMVGKDGRPLIYDWELAVMDFPHRDVVEFLSFVLPKNFEEDLLFYYLRQHYQLYENVSWEEWIKVYPYSLKTYIISRVSFYEVSGILIEYEFSKRILNTALKMLTIIQVYLVHCKLNCENVLNDE